MKVSTRLVDLGLISGQKTCNIFDTLYPDILTTSHESPSEFIREYWSRYSSGEVSMNGAVFEGLLSTILFKNDILPIFVQAKLAYVPNVNFDFVAYCKEYGPVVLSAKTSLRERYKQADLEGMMLRQVHRRSKCFLITLHYKEARSVNKKIQEGLVLGLDEVIVATEPEFDDLIAHMKTLNFYQPEKIDVLTSSRIIEINNQDS